MAKNHIYVTCDGNIGDAIVPYNLVVIDVSDDEYDDLMKETMTDRELWMWAQARWFADNLEASNR